LIAIWHCETAAEVWAVLNEAAAKLIGDRANADEMCTSCTFGSQDSHPAGVANDFNKLRQPSFASQKLPPGTPREPGNAAR
jgi:hypothetical protein